MKLFACFFLFAIGAGSAQDREVMLLKTSMEQGSEIYRKDCAVCHKKNGAGKGSRIPPLAQSDFLLTKTDESIRGIKYGQEGEITVNGIVYDKVMKPLKLSNREIADVMNYILNSWGNRAETMITQKRVAEALAE